MQKKLWMSMMAAVLVIGLILAGCSVGGNPADKGKTKLTYMMWGTPSERAAVDKYLNSYRAKHPDVVLEVIHVPSSNYGAKLQTLIAGQTPPDVMYMGLEDFPRYAKNNAFLDLDSYFAKDTEFNIKDFYPVLMDQFRYNGKYYGVAKDFATLVLYYNKDLFDKDKVAYPNDKWTWKEFRDAAEKLTKDTNGDGKPEQYGFVLETWLGEWLPWARQNNGEIISEDGKKWLLGDPKYINQNVEALEFLTGLIYGPKPVAPSPTITTDLGTSDLFKTGKVAMCTYGRWMCMDFKDIKTFKWDVSVLPYNKKRSSTLFTVCYAISARSKNPDKAWELVKFLTGPEGQVSTAEAGHAIPSMIKYADSDHFLKAPVLPAGLNSRANLDSISYAKPSPFHPAQSEINTLLSREMDLVWRNQAKPKDVILKVQPKIEKLMADSDKSAPAPAAK